MYLCGDTVYDYCHMGHARSKTAFDIVRRYFQYRGYKVTFVRNITDIDDNIIKRAAENGESVQSLTSRFTKAMHEDYDRLGLLRPDFEPKATEHVPGIIAMIEQLIAKGNAYVATNGDVMYSVSSFPDYGKLSGRQLGDLRAGARVAVDEAKRDPLDFVLWKQAKPGEPHWSSPWGEGRPGWHIECSAMTYELLGATLRHSRRRHGPEVPASRERDRAVLRRDRRRLREPVDAQRLPQRRRREDVEVAEQLLPHPRRARLRRSARSGSACATSWPRATIAGRSTIRWRRSSRRMRR